MQCVSEWENVAASDRHRADRLKKLSVVPRFILKQCDGLAEKATTAWE